LSVEQARHLTVHGVRRNENGTYSWKFDNYVRARSPYKFNLQDAADIWSHITSPTLLVRGSESWTRDWEKAGRTRMVPNARLITIQKAGHWVHHDRFDEFLAATKGFLGL
jgi:pimeloyl-ACP methyl ester carboxylesterase